MVQATSELIYRTLQQMQETMADHTRRFEAMDRRFDGVDQKIEDPTKLAVTSMGLAGIANVRHDQVISRLAAFEQQLGLPENLTRRVGVLEQAR